jgi:hypothetical protein
MSSVEPTAELLTGPSTLSKAQITANAATYRKLRERSERAQKAVEAAENRTAELAEELEELGQAWSEADAGTMPAADELAERQRIVDLIEQSRKAEQLQKEALEQASAALQEWLNKKTETHEKRQRDHAAEVEMTAGVQPTTEHNVATLQTQLEESKPAASASSGGVPVITDSIGADGGISEGSVRSGDNSHQGSGHSGKQGNQASADGGDKASGTGSNQGGAAGPGAASEGGQLTKKQQRLQMEKEQKAAFKLLQTQKTHQKTHKKEGRGRKGNQSDSSDEEDGDVGRSDDKPARGVSTDSLAMQAKRKQSANQQAPRQAPPHPAPPRSQNCARVTPT